MFNQRRPRRFSYKTKLPNSKEIESEKELKAKWDEIRKSTNRKKSVLTSSPILLIFLVLIFVLIYILNGYLK